jgi:hypothetical protein
VNSTFDFFTKVVLDPNRFIMVLAIMDQMLVICGMPTLVVDSFFVNKIF